MKSYPEALAELRAKDLSPESIAKVYDHAARGVDLATEILSDEMTHALIWGIVTAIRGTEPGCDCPGCHESFSVAMTAFLNGVRVGIEMEKQEGGIAQ